MKKISYIIFSILLTTGIVSCKKFLDVTPKTQMPQDVNFSNQEGFKDALTGVYIQLKDANAYGRAMTQTTIEQLISNWDVTTNTTEQRLGLFNFDDEGVQGRFTSIWRQQFKIIASINSILGQIDERKNVFVDPLMYDLVKSECLGLRAYLHFDILRLFGPVGGNLAAGPSLPYVTELSNSPHNHITVGDFKTKLFKDLTDAENLIKGKDPIEKYSLSQLRNPGISSGFNPDDQYSAFRYIRMNYYAIRALQARAYLWFGEKGPAYQAAKEVIDASNDGGDSKFRLGVSSDFSASPPNFVLSNEHIFGLYAYNLDDIYNSLYSGGGLKKGSTQTTIKNTLYGNTGTDIRESSLWELITLANASQVYTIKKYKSEKNPALSSDYKQIPMLRLSEMYLIAAETAPFDDGVEYFKTFRTARNIGSFPDPENSEELKSEIIKEYRKEFYAEGQAFFAYKRVNAVKASIVFVPAAAEVNYVVPIPKEETVNF